MTKKLMICPKAVEYDPKGKRMIGNTPVKLYAVEDK